MRRTLSLLLCLTSSAAFAHDLWFAPEGNDYLLLQGHRHSGHAGADTIDYDGRKVSGALCLDGTGKARPATPSPGAPVRFAGPCAVLQADYVSGYWTKTAWETKNIPKTGISGVLRSWHSAESVKRIGQWIPAAGKPLGRGLEITPLRDPLPLQPGDKLTVLVSDDGKPVAGVPVAYGDDTRGVSDGDGKIAIRLRHGGTQLITTTLETPLTDGKADRSLRSATLQFEIAP